MKNRMILAALAAMTLGFSACEKEAPVETVAITVTSPTAASTHHSGHHLNVNVTYTDPTELHMYSLLIVNTTTSDTLLNLSGHKHSTSHTIDTMLTLNVATHSDMELHAEVSNHAGETAHKHVDFHVHP